MSVGDLFQSLSHVLVEVLLPIALMALVGFLIRRRLQIDVRSVSRIVFYILAPCLIYTSIITLDIEIDTIWRTLAFAASFMVLMGSASYLLARRWHYSSSLGAAFVMCSIILNNGNYGLPLNLFAFGPDGFDYALILYLFNSLVGSTVSIYLLARGENGGRLALRRTLATPVVWAIILGFISRTTGIMPTGSLFDMLYMTGRSAIPVFLIILGMSLAQASAHVNIRPVSRLTALRMFGGPTLAIILARLVGLSGLAYTVAVLQGSMPTAVNAIVISNEFEATPDFVAGSVFITTLVSMLTLPTLLLWLT